MLNRKNLLTAALTSASLAAIAMPTSAWAQATPNVTADCTEAVEEVGNNPAATQFDPVTGDPILDPVTGDPVLVAAGDIIPFSTQCGVNSQASGSGATALGNVAQAAGAFSTAVGAGSFALADGSVALGSGAFVAAGATDSVAIGNGSEAIDALTVSFGREEDLTDPLNPIAAISRRLTNVAAGTGALDAVNKGQLDAATVDDKFIAINPSAGAANASASVAGSLAIGGGSKANFANALVIGEDASADASGGVALGFSSGRSANAIGTRQDYGCWRNRILPR